ncbi:hypothetical protein ACFL08_03470 [Patescibacteria group bacterium]
MGLEITCVAIVVGIVVMGLYALSHLKTCLNCGRGLGDAVDEILIVFSHKESQDGSGEMIEDKSFYLCRGCLDSQKLDYDHVIEEFEQDNPSCTGKEQVQLRKIIDKINNGEYEEV